MTLLRWRFGRAAPDVLSRSSGPPAGRHVMSSPSFEPGSTAGAVLPYHAAAAQAASADGITHRAVSRPHCIVSMLTDTTQPAEGRIPQCQLCPRAPGTGPPSPRAS